MGRIFVAVGPSMGRDNYLDLSLATSSALAAQEMSLLRDLIVQILRSRNYELLPVPADLPLPQTVDWINQRARRGDVALELWADAFDRTTRGAVVFYMTYNNQRKTQAEQLLQAYLRRVPQMPGRGAKPDIQTELGQLAFCRQVMIPALQLSVGSLIDLDDRRLIQTQRQDVALGIAEGLATWSRAVSPDRTTSVSLPVEYPAIDLSVNGATCDELGVLIEGNAYIPVDLIDQLGIDLPLSSAIRRLSYRNIVFVRAIDLRDYNLSTRLEENNNTLGQNTLGQNTLGHNALRLALRSGSSLASDSIDRIMGQGHTSDVQMMVFLKSHYSDGLARFPELPKLYREEASIEGVNADIAFAQMCVETSFLRFSGTTKPEQNNFAGLGTLSSLEAASFSSPRIGIRAQIQHLKAYASTGPFVQAIVDPRFSSIRRGIAPFLSQLNGRWTADLQYHNKILSVLRRLYESAGFL